MTLDQWRARRQRREFFLCLVVYGLGAVALTALAFLFGRLLMGAV